MEWLSSAKSSSLELHQHALLFFILIATISALFLRKTILGRTKHWPPGPPSLPLIGHLHLLGELPHQSLSRLAQSYGPLMGLRLGGIPTIVASSPAMAKEILQTHDLAFANRPRLAASVHVCFDCADVAFAPYGPYWKFLRQLYASELFSPKRLDAFRHVREEEVRVLTRSVLGDGRQGEEELELRPSLMMTSNNINCRMVMGKKITEVSATVGSDGADAKLDLLSLVEEVVHLCGVFYVGDYMPWLAWLDPNGYLKRMKTTGRRVKAVLQDVINKRRSESQGEKQGPQDLLDVLLAASQDKDRAAQITDHNIMAAVLDIFAGGSDTSSVTVEWALANLINNPRIMQKVQEELDNVVGRERLVDESDISNLPFLGLVVKESMRLHPAAPLLIPHEAIQECQIGGYNIPAKSRAYVNTWAIGRDSSTWERPLEFWPERFGATNFDLRGQNFELLPFGSGRRRCPGWALGLLNVHLMLATLAQGFTWSVESPSRPNDGSHTPIIDMSERFGLTVSMSKPLCAFATPRLPLQLY
eukprot:c21004_g1_i1 orf=84-1676(+)